MERKLIIRELKATIQSSAIEYGSVAAHEGPLHSFTLINQVDKYYAKWVNYSHSLRKAFVYMIKDRSQIHKKHLDL